MADVRLEDWVGREERNRDRLAGVHACAVAAMLDQPAALQDGMEVSGLWYWFFFLPQAPTAGLGSDGHPKRGGFLPPVALERRMWAGSRMAFPGALRVGDEIEKRSTIVKVAEREGRAGPMVFVTVRHEVSTPRGLAVEEEQDIVYLAMPKSYAPPEPVPVPGDLAWSAPHALSTVLLFRFSALTFNAHRIHYDRPYANGVEKYPGLVVHGPLQALLLFEAAKARHPDRRPGRFVFRAVRPLFDFDALTLSGRPAAESGLDLWTSNGDGHVNMQASIHWR